MNSVLINSSLKPSQVNEVRWLYCHDEVIYARLNIFDPNKSGKWMMFFKKGDELDGKWKQACDLYRQGTLTGIRTMKVSTALFNPERSSDVDNGLICFYCGPADDENTLMKYGKNLLDHISYKPIFNVYMNYKSDAQTMAGTFATGQKINSLYKIRVSDDPSPAVGNTFSRQTDQPGAKKSYAQGNSRHFSRHENNWRTSVSRPEETTEETNWRLLPRKQNYLPHPSNCNWRQQKSDPK